MNSQLHYHSIIGSGYILLQLQEILQSLWKVLIHIRDKLFPVLDSVSVPQNQVLGVVQM